ncbi:MAG: tRNA pseudouridine(38-40) synthase TruA [Clostridia bacterium]|nr:tRNA pseudouridine(38-40) synthase TruA [Clostridia bacterium]
MRNILIRLSYNGTAYHGWQVQQNAKTVQETLQDAVEIIFNKRESITGCSRTDSGVHANEYYCTLRTENQIPCERLVNALNGNLPFDIAVLSCAEVPLEFHPRYDCKEKEYIYKIWNSEIRNPFYLNTHLHYKYQLDTEKLDKVSKQFIGTHDFTSFCAAGGSVEDKVRTVKNFSVERYGNEVIMRVSADGFLYNMVRIMVGTLLDVSSGKIDGDSIPQIIESKKRENAGVTAPAHGLYLNRVIY